MFSSPMYDPFLIKDEIKSQIIRISEFRILIEVSLWYAKFFYAAQNLKMFTEWNWKKTDKNKKKYVSREFVHSHFFFVSPMWILAWLTVRMTILDCYWIRNIQKKDKKFTHISSTWKSFNRESKRKWKMKIGESFLTSSNIVWEIP